MSKISNFTLSMDCKSCDADKQEQSRNDDSLVSLKKRLVQKALLDGWQSLHIGRVNVGYVCPSCAKAYIGDDDDTETNEPAEAITIE